MKRPYLMSHLGAFVKKNTFTGQREQRYHHEEVLLRN